MRYRRAYIPDVDFFAAIMDRAVTTAANVTMMKNRWLEMNAPARVSKS